MKSILMKSPILSPIDRPFLEEFSSSIQKNTTNESYSMTEKGTLAFTTSTKKIKTSFEDVSSNLKFESIPACNVIEFEEFNPPSKEVISLTAKFGMAGEGPSILQRELEKNNEILLKENDELKKRLSGQSKELEILKENLGKIEKGGNERKTEELLKEILVLKQSLVEMNQNCKDSDIENIKLKEEIENRGDKIQQCIEKIKCLEREIARKEQKIGSFTKESKSLNDNENLAQKNMLFTEKIAQMADLIETQKQIMSKNEKKIDNLLRKLDEMAMINNSKSAEISKLRYENSSLRDEIENLKNKFFIKNHEKNTNFIDKTQMELYEKEKILSLLDENLDNLENKKKMEIQQKIKKLGNKSNHLTHSSLNFEVSVNGHFGLHSSDFTSKETAAVNQNLNKQEGQSNPEYVKLDSSVPIQSPKITRMGSQQNLSVSKNPENTQKNRQTPNLSNEKHHHLHKNAFMTQQNFCGEIERNPESRKQEKGLSPSTTAIKPSSAKSKSKDKKSLTDLSILVNQITNRRPPKNENCSNSNHSKVDVSGKISNVSKSNRSSSSIKYSIELGNGHMVKESSKSNHSHKQANENKENTIIKTERVNSSEFKNFSNLRAPHKMFGNKTGIIMNNYLRNTEDEFEDVIRKRNEF